MYIDIYFLVNLILNRCMLGLALQKYRLPGRRLWLGSVLGGLGACLWEAAVMPVILRPVGALALSVIMIGICMGGRSRAQRRQAVVRLYLYSFLMAGVIPWVSRYIPLWIGAVGLSYIGLKLWLFWQERRRAASLQVKIETGNGQCFLQGILDSGHRLREPITGRPVLIVREERLPKDLRTGWPISFDSVQGRGTMPGFWADAIWIDGKRFGANEIMVAAAQGWQDETCEVLVPGYLMENDL